MQKVWNEKKLTEKNILTQLLKNRGIKENSEIENFLNPKKPKLISPFIFSDMEKAVLRVKKAVLNKEHILIWGDFDADGVSSTALLYKVFEEIGANFSHFIPTRQEQGHGLNSKVLVKLISKNKLKLVITVDCGISDNPIISMLKGLGVDTIITDHHRAGEIIPEALAVINPRALGAIKEEATVSEIKSLCNLAGVGVAYKFACAIIDEFKIDLKIQKELLTLAALGTIGDIVPLLGENRTLVALGLDEINKKSHFGIQKLFENLKIENEINSENIAFLLTPRINAAGRLSTPNEAFDLLTAKSEAVVEAAIQKLNHYNAIRQTLCDETYEACIKKLDSKALNNSAIVLFDETWHVGIIGIVASRLVETYNKPVFLATQNAKGEGRCSIRGLLPFNIYEILKENENLLIGFGGHAFAGGFAFDENEHSFNEIKEAIFKTIAEKQNEEIPQNTLDIDLELDITQINENLICAISSLEPLGEGNPYPVFSIKNAILENFKQIGKDGSHLKFEIRKDDKIFNCVWWKKTNFKAEISSKIDLAFCPKVNVFNGNKTIQLETIDFKGEINEAETKVKIYDHRKKQTKEILTKINNYILKNTGIKIFANKISTQQMLQNYEAIYKNIENEAFFKCDEIMFFDYPVEQNSLEILLKFCLPKKIHLMYEDLNENPSIYIENIYKMAKFAQNKKNGAVNPEKMGKLLGVSTDFVKIALEFLESINAIKLNDGEKIEILSRNINFSNEEFCKNPLYEILLEELNNIFNYKKQLMSADVDYFNLV